MSKAPFKYSVRVSPKSRTVRLRVTLQTGLEVVVPKGYDESKIPTLLERKKHWVRAALERAEANRKFFEPEPSWRLPLQIKLTAVGMVWHVTARQTDVAWVAVREIGAGQLLIFGDIDNQQACQAALIRWLLRQANQYLLPRLQTLSGKTGLRYNRAMVKRQRTRWASCSKRGAVSLNAKLLFLPPDVVDYVMTHELCHLEEMNHSRQFWQLVASHYPDYLSRDAALREMWKVVPRWAS